MALNEYYDIYTAKDYSQRVKNIKSSVEELINNGYFDSLKNSVLTQIERLKEKEQKIYEILNLEDKSIEGLNERLKEYQKAAINLSGPYLNAELIYILQQQNEKEYEFYRKKVDELVDGFLTKLNPNLSDEDFQNEILKFLGSYFESDKRHFTSLKGIDGAAKKVVYAAITPHQREQWKRIIGKPDYSDIELTNTDEDIILNFNWKKVTKNLTPTEARDQEAKKEIDVNEINELVIKKIKSLVPSDSVLIEQIIREKILSQNKYAFFVGDNINDIVGICGEIQGIYYLAKIMGAKNISDLNNIDWIGGKIDGSSKPHRDILLGRFGIQVKNSLREDFHEIRFGSTTLETALEKSGLSKESKNLLNNYYGTLSFNVPYDYKDKKYIEMQSPEDALETQNKPLYVASYNDLVNLNKDIEILLSLCASAFLYMDISYGWGQMDANTIYLVGGAAFITASSILIKILKEIEQQEKSIKFSSSYTDLANKKNIVSALNNNRRDPNYSQAVVQNIVLKSTFDFSYLNNFIG